MTEVNNKVIINIDDMQQLHGKPFRVAQVAVQDGKVVPREEWRTGYAWYLAKKGAHKLGRFQDRQFMTRDRYVKGDFRPDDYAAYEFANPETGKITNFFEKKMILSVDFLKQESFELYSKEAGKKVATPATAAYVAFSAGVYRKIMEQFEDPRTNVYDYFVLSYNASNPPPTKYVVKFYQGGQPFNAAPVAAPTNPVAVALDPSFKMTTGEKDLLMEIRGETATKDEVVEYLKVKAKNATTPVSPERLLEIATNVVVGGRVLV